MSTETRDLIDTFNTLPATALDNPFTAYGKGSGSRIKGQLLKFSKGEYLAGQENTEIPEGTQLAVNFDQFLIGWQRWEDGKPAEDRMGFLSKSYVVEERENLGFLDPKDWEQDNRGEPRDPWQLSNMVIMKEPTPDGQLYTFTTQSGGGINALRQLSEAYGVVFLEHPDEWPIVSLGVRSYKHSSYGKIATPDFKIVGWAPKSIFEDSEPEEKDPEFKGRKQKAR